MDESLKSVLRIAAKTKFYRVKYGEQGIDLDNDSRIDFQNVPIITKKEVQQNLEDCVNKSVVNAGNKHLLKIIRTTGSTGKFIELTWLNDDFQKSNLELWRLRRKWYGIMPSSKCVCFNSSVYNGNRIEKAEKMRLYSRSMYGFSKFWMEDEDIISYFNEMLKYEPEWLLIQPSTCLRLIEVMDKYGLSLPSSLKYVELNGEMVIADTEDYIRRKFNVAVANMYGANEVNGIALECPCHKMHVLEKNVFLESKDVGGVKTAIVTSLKNTALPIIRYNLEDEIEIDDEKECGCGLCSKTIRVLGGRTVEREKLSNTRYLSPYIFVYGVERLNAQMGNPILQFQIHKQSNVLTIVMVVKPEYEGWKNTIIREFNHELEEHVRRANIEIKTEITTESIFDSEKKYRMVVDDDE